MLHDLIVFWFDLVRDWGYSGVVFLMALESSIFPVPSEVVVPPAAYWAAEGRMNVWGVILAGTVGSWLGAAATYWGARWLGRPLLDRWGRWVLMPPDKVARAERLLGRYAAAGIFFARLLPVVRHLIGIPAGLVRMDFRTYSLMTLLGSALWCSVLAWFGWRAGTAHPGAIQDPARFVAAMKADLLWIVVAIAALCALYLLMLRLTARREPASQG